MYDLNNVDRDTKTLSHQNITADIILKYFPQKKETSVFLQFVCIFEEYGDGCVGHYFP